MQKPLHVDFYFDTVRTSAFFHGRFRLKGDVPEKNVSFGHCPNPTPSPAQSLGNLPQKWKVSNSIWAAQKKGCFFFGTLSPTITNFCENVSQAMQCQYHRMFHKVNGTKHSDNRQDLITPIKTLQQRCPPIRGLHLRYCADTERGNPSFLRWFLLHIKRKALF